MLRALRGFVIVFAVTSSAAELRAEDTNAEAEDSVHHHGGLYARIGVGAGAFGDSVKSDAVPDQSVSGLAIAYEAALGATPFRGLVIAGALWGAWVPNPSIGADAPTDEVETSAVVLHALGVHADYYFRPSGGFHAQAFAGYAFLTGIQGDLAAPDGFGFGIGGGYEWWLGEDLSVGVLGRVMYAPLGTAVSGIDQAHTVTLPALLVTGTYH